MDLYSRLVGHPWVFEHVRPLIVGGIDMSPAYRLLKCDSASSVLDVGCGAGDALRHLPEFAAYLGVDTDPTAIKLAASRYASRANVKFECRTATSDDFAVLAPTHVVMVGLLHHLTDAEAVSVLTMAKSSPRLVRVATLDIVFLKGRPYNNLLARADRGRYCRFEGGYVRLAEEAGLRVVAREVVRSHPTRGLVRYFVMELMP